MPTNPPRIHRPLLTNTRRDSASTLGHALAYPVCPACAVYPVYSVYPYRASPSRPVAPAQGGGVTNADTLGATRTSPLGAATALRWAASGASGRVASRSARRGNIPVPPTVGKGRSVSRIAHSFSQWDSCHPCGADLWSGAQGQHRGSVIGGQFTLLDWCNHPRLWHCQVLV